MAKVLALDLQACIGWAAPLPGGVHYSHWDFKREAAGWRGELELCFGWWMEDVVERMGGIDEIYYLDRDAGGAGNLLRVLESWCEERLVSLQAISWGAVADHLQERFARTNAYRCTGSDTFWLLDYVLGELGAAYEPVEDSGG